MPIPEVPRVIYQKSALEEVICQLKFPSILKIGAEIPAEFQECIRQQFPLFEEKTQNLPSDLPPQIAEVILKKIQSNDNGKSYSFLTAERDWTVSLSSAFLALSTSNYIQWEGFKGHLKSSLESFNTIYKPSFYSRLGLRYRDVIIRSKLGLAGVPWSELLKDHISGILSEPNVKDEIIQLEKEFILNLGDDVGMVRVKHFLAKIKEDDEACYVIDADFFTDAKTEPENAIEKLNQLNSYAGRLFRWCIHDKLHEAMEPESPAQN